MPAATNRYLDPLSDFGFKHLFGRVSTKAILLDFLNALFEGHKTILDISYSPTEYAGQYKGLKKVYFDILCTGNNGEQFIIEMQRNQQLYFRERCVYYLSRLFNEQLAAGESNWNIELKDVYLIGILEFPLLNNRSSHCYHDIGLADRQNKKVFYKGFGIKLIELINFNNQEDNLNTKLEKWIYLLKYLHVLKEIPAVLKSPIFERVFELAELANLTKEERMKYDSGLKAYHDHQRALAYATQSGELKGKLAGRLEGQLEEKQSLAKKLKAQRFPINQICEITGLAIDVIKKLK